jgi:hypothetical protein
MVDFLDNTQNPFLRMETASQEYSPYFSRSSTKFSIGSLTEYEKENCDQTSNNVCPKIPEVASCSQDLPSTSNPFVGTRRLTLPHKRKSDFGEDGQSKQLNLDRFMYSFRSTSM